jgi:hypothetical protein
MTRYSKQDQFDDIATSYHQVQHGEMPHRVGAKDGSIATHPVVSCYITQPESEVLTDCLGWLKRHKVFCNRLNNGKGDFGSGFATYGIIGAGDIIGLLPKTGQHFEIECKAGIGGRLGVKQQERMARIRENNGIYLVIHGLPELEVFMKGLI